MRKGFVSGAFALVVVLMPAGSFNAAAHSHGHKHREVHNKLVKKPLASSGSSLVVSIQDSVLTISELEQLEPGIKGLAENTLQDPHVRRRSRIEQTNADNRRNVLSPRQDGGYGGFVGGGLPAPSTTSSAASSSPTSICPNDNGTTYTSAAGIDYLITCDIDYLNNDFPFQSVRTFEDCVQKCDAYNWNHHNAACIAALFVPSRSEYDNDCYLKWSIANPMQSIVGEIQGAIRLGFATDPTTSSSAGVVPSASTSQTTSLTPSNTGYNSAPSGSSAFPFTTESPTAEPTASSSDPGVTYASGGSVIAPKVKSSQLQGSSTNSPTKQYLDVESLKGITLPKELLTIGVNTALTTDYPISPDTGVLQVNSSTQSHLSPITDVPHISRDGGKGGIVNGQHLFVFCDTGSYSTATESSDGSFLGFVSSSVAVDVGFNGAHGSALNLQDGIGQWSDNSGRMRGFAPLTTGELAYNYAVQGSGGRIAVWPESSIIPLDATRGIIIAPIVYDEVNVVTRAAKFTYTGSTLLTITADNEGGPVAERTVTKLFNQDEVEWGCVGGLRSWGPSGVGGDDGSVYLFANNAGGLLLARVPAQKVADRDSYTYWDGGSWTDDMPSNSSTAHIIEGAFMDIDIFYSPRHLTFIAVYMNIYADSTFYYRYLQADQAIIPPSGPGGDTSSDYVENILKYKWSEEQVLYKAEEGLDGHYTYSGGPHLGYYGSEDISNGGSKMLLSWTSPTGQKPETYLSEYQMPTAEIDWA